MNGKITGWTKKTLRAEIIGRMDALNTSDEEFSNKELMKDFESLHKSTR